MSSVQDEKFVKANHTVCDDTCLTLKAPITTAADAVMNIFPLFFSEKDLIFHVKPLPGRGFT